MLDEAIERWSWYLLVLIGCARGQIRYSGSQIGSLNYLQAAFLSLNRFEKILWREVWVSLTPGRWFQLFGTI
jgi:hypothetical protein